MLVGEINMDPKFVQRGKPIRIMTTDHYYQEKFGVPRSRDIYDRMAFGCHTLPEGIMLIDEPKGLRIEKTREQ